jgi:hypothetical protein
VLITTNALARGVDVPAVAVVVNYDLPTKHFGYHRNEETVGEGTIYLSFIFIVIGIGIFVFIFMLFSFCISFHFSFFIFHFSFFIFHFSHFVYIFHFSNPRAGTMILMTLIMVTSAARGIGGDSKTTGGKHPPPQQHVAGGYVTYVHRIGRCSRFGRRGVAINLLYGEQDRAVMRQIEEYFCPSRRMTTVSTLNAEC